jgi:threonine dehydrogenase-like Zn-dependent dehydrogenase
VRIAQLRSLDVPEFTMEKRPMKALVIDRLGHVGVADKDVRQPTSNDVVVATIATGICGSDIHGLAGDTGRRSIGQVMGHETVGRIVTVGPGVSASRLGQLVTINPVMSCGICAMCLSHREEMCAEKWVLGVRPDIDGAFAEYLTVPESSVIELPDLTIEHHGALIEPLAVGYHALLRANPRPEDKLLIIGGGPIGQAVAIASRRLQLPDVLVSEPDAARRSMLEDLGFPTVSPDDLNGGLERALDGRATVVVDAVGSKQTLATAMACSVNGARIVLVGMASPEVTVSAYDLSTGERTLIGSFCYSRRNFDSTATWVAENPEIVEMLCDVKVPLVNGADTLNQLVDGSLVANKVLLIAESRD